MMPQKIDINKKKSEDLLNLDEKYRIKLPKFDPSMLFKDEKKIGSDPKKILEEIELKENDIVVDFGAGIGFFVIESAKIVGSGGRVIAVDIDKNILASLKIKAIESGLKNIYGVRADLEVPGSTNIDSDSADVVLIINLLYLVEKKQEVIAEAYRILKKGGRLAIMDWKEKGTLTTIEKNQIISSRDIKEMAKKIGFIYRRTFEAGLSHEVNVFTK